MVTFTDYLLIGFSKCFTYGYKNAFSIDLNIYFEIYYDYDYFEKISNIIFWNVVEWHDYHLYIYIHTHTHTHDWSK